MNIAVNTRLLLDNNMTGISWYIFETMQRFVEKHPEHTFYYIFDRPYDKKFITAPNIIPVVIPFKCRFHPYFYTIWYDLLVPMVLKMKDIDLFISGDGVLSLTTKIPTILVIHDLAFEHYPTFIPKKMSNYLRSKTSKYAHKAVKIATVSEYSKKDIAERYGIEEAKIGVVYNGTHQLFKPLTVDQKTEVKNKYAEGNDYFLFVGTIHPRKNLHNQLLGFEMFRKENPDAKHKFIAVGNTWIWDKALNDIYESLEFKSDVNFIGHLPTFDLTQIVSAATALMYASIFEGFGIPIIEAFQSETPVITSNTSSMPEVAADAAILVDPFNPLEIANAMSAIYTNPALRAQLIEKGRTRKECFTWSRTSDLFDEIVTPILK
ncbi:MAG: glycosyltransferase family 1 protein [Salinivirgaceae bacterium]|nr:glycosyltransferase family 1 protein [Salinivirgaceae bacterium]MDD4746049.1 glycosyltransferase family 1 protein [Salinivirgaceae bacterium]MDY0279321.1 glycosyltransferase family 1 protein [Salinivirgaceae bacterium]